jgi:hypothetical protein
MTGGLIQLVAYGVQDIFLTRDPQITFFKVVYRRHTNFSTEPIPQFFTQKPDFGKKSTCIISKNGDLLGTSYLVITLPKIKDYTSISDPYTKFAWVRKIGYALIKSIEIEIGGQTIDKHYGEWLNIWTELTCPKFEGINKLIGNIPELTELSKGKDEYTLYIPLQFWFCRNIGLALPLVSLQYSDVKITVELNDADKCYILSPTHYIEVENDIINFTPFEYIEQNINGTICTGLFTDFDILKKRLYFVKISKDKFSSLGIDNPLNLTPVKIREEIFREENRKYLIYGKTTNTTVMPKINSSVQTYSNSKFRNINIKECYLLLDYIYLDEEERLKFVQSKHDYLVEHVTLLDEKNIESTNRFINIGLIQPCKFITWTVQANYLVDKTNNDQFNYTDNYIYKNGKQIGNSLINNQTILLNGNARLSYRRYEYFNHVQPYQHFNCAPSEGINLYSFCLTPMLFQPSGSCSMGQIKNIQIHLNLSSSVSINNQVKFKGYAMGYNILRIVNGLAGLIFTR